MNGPQQSTSGHPLGAGRDKGSLGSRRGVPDAAAALAGHPELLADKSVVLDLAYEELLPPRRGRGIT